jgi:23S rRNA (adenine2503-C2)-methyltransferase
MPVNDRFPLPDVLAECHRYFALRRPQGVRRVRDARGVNDSPSVRRSCRRCSIPKVFKVNLIPYNPTGMYDGSSRARSPRSSTCSTARGCRRRFV